MRTPGVGGLQLPSIGQLFSGNVLIQRNEMKQVAHDHSYECSYVTPHVISPHVEHAHSSSRMGHEKVELLENQIQSMETLIAKQSRIIQNYETENKKRKLENEELKHKLEETKQKKRKQQTFSKVSDTFINDTFTISKSLSIEESNDSLGDFDEFSVIWKGETFVLIDVFKNRNKIINYFIPLYQTQFPDKKCKIVLSSDEYGQLFKENSHRGQSERKHAWRISIFTLDFYNFVKNQM